MSEKGFNLSGWLIIPDEGTLSRGDDLVHLEPKVMEVLVYFAAHPGKVISREELEREVWRGALVGYDAVTATVIKLRKALQDDAKDSRIIATIPKKGYQLIAEVTDAAETQKPGTTIPTPPAEPQRKLHRRHFLFASVAFLMIGMALVWMAMQPPTTSTPPSIVVLPIENLDGNQTHEVFVDGITEDIITDLSRMAGLMVFASNTSFKYKGRQMTPQSLRDELQVDYVLKGSARRSGDEIRLNVQLVNAATGLNVWAQRYDRKVDEVFAVQDEINGSLVNALAIKLSTQEKQRLARRATTNLAAYELFLEGQRVAREYTQQASSQALELYRQATQVDPGFGRAYGAMGFLLSQNYARGWTDNPVETLDRALALAEQGVALDDSIPQTYWSLGYVHFRRKEFKAAEQAISESIRIAPNYADGYGMLALIYNYQGQAEQALAYATKGMQLNPYYTWDYLFNAGLAHYLLGDYKKAITFFEKAQTRNENVIPIKLYLAASYVHVGRQDDAEWTVDQLLVLNPATTIKHTAETITYSDPKLKAELLNDLRQAGLPEQ